jgi:hypothetical protein
MEKTIKTEDQIDQSLLKQKPELLCGLKRFEKIATWTIWEWIMEEGNHVTHVKWMRTFWKEWLDSWRKKSKTCPICIKKVKNKYLKVNKTMNDVIECINQTKNEQKFYQCNSHNKRGKFFWKECIWLLWKDCIKSKKHSDHDFEDIEEISTEIN